MRNFQINNNTLVKVKKKDIFLFNNEKIFTIISPDEIGLINDISKVPKYTIKECKLSNHHLRIDHHPEYIYGILSVLEVHKNKLGSVDFNFFLTSNSLVIINKNENKLLEQFVVNVTNKELIQVYEKVTPQILLLHLINEIIEKNEYYIDKIEENLEELEEKILNNAKKEYSKEIISKRRLIMQLRHRTEFFPFLVKTLFDDEYNLFNENQLKMINIIDYKATKMVENAILLREYASQVREAFEAERDIKTNDLMKIFTIVTSVFLPLTLIAGWYGMNFTNMPEITWKYGYPCVIILSIIVIISLLIFFKKKKLV